MKYKLTTFIADRMINKFMSSLGMREHIDNKEKWFCAFQDLMIDTKSIVDEGFIHMFMKASRCEYLKNGCDFWIPAIIYQDQLFSHPDSLCISDGKYEMYFPILAEAEG